MFENIEILILFKHIIGNLLICNLIKYLQFNIFLVVLEY
jgi:hypothetical protein